MNTETQPAMNRDAMINAIAAHIAQRSGIDFRNYGDRESFMGDYRPILRAGKDARTMLNWIRWHDSITAENLREASRAYSGRLSFVERNGKVACDYCAGQYFPTEYRNAACAVLARAIWDYFRDNMPSGEVAKSPEGAPNVTQGTVNAGEYIRRKARQEFGRGIASRWFN